MHRPLTLSCHHNALPIRYNCWPLFPALFLPSRPSWGRTRAVRSCRRSCCLFSCFFLFLCCRLSFLCLCLACRLLVFWLGVSCLLRLRRRSCCRWPCGACLRGGGANEPRYNNPELARKSKEAYERAKETKDRLAKRYKGKTVAADGATSLSGWGRRRRGFQKPNVNDVFNKQKEIGHPKKPHNRDNGVFGRYNASHAERQEAVTAVEPAIGVSRRLCEDCHDFFIRLAQHEGREWYVTDPGGTSVFRPDGTRLGPDGQVTGLGQGYRYSERGARGK